MKNKCSELETEFLADEALWNSHNVAFIKQDIYEGKNMWLIYDAEGERVAATDDREFAFIVARQNDLDPYSVH